MHGRLIGSAFATAPVVCLTLAKWETVSGQFGGYLTMSESGTSRHFVAVPKFRRYGGEADMPRPPAPYLSDAIDPMRRFATVK